MIMNDMSKLFKAHILVRQSMKNVVSAWCNDSKPEKCCMSCIFVHNTCTYKYMYL